MAPQICYSLCNIKLFDTYCLCLTTGNNSRLFYWTQVWLCEPLFSGADCVLLRGADWMVSGEKVNGGGINDFRALCAALALHQLVSRSCWRSPSPTALRFWEWPLDQEDQLPDTTQDELSVFILLHVCMQDACCIQCRGLAPPTKTCRSGSRSAAAGRCQSSGRCRLPV